MVGSNLGKVSGPWRWCGAVCENGDEDEGTSMNGTRLWKLGLLSAQQEQSRLKEDAIPYAMDELAHDLASALDETSEQNRLDEEIWDGPGLCPRQQQRRQSRKRRGRKRRSNSNHSLDYTRCYSEVSESSQDEVGLAAGGADTDSDDDRAVVKRLSSLNVTLKGKYHNWHESDSFTENSPGQPLRRRRKVKRVTSGSAGDVSATLQKKLKVSEPRPGSQSPSCPLKPPSQHKKQRLSKAAGEESWLSPEGRSIQHSLRLEGGL
eukprot:g26928.t1